jgi:hypothetical protein
MKLLLSIGDYRGQEKTNGQLGAGAEEGCMKCEDKAVYLGKGRMQYQNYYRFVDAESEWRKPDGPLGNQLALIDGPPGPRTHQKLLESANHIAKINRAKMPKDAKKKERRKHGIREKSVLFEFRDFDLHLDSMIDPMHGHKGVVGRLLRLGLGKTTFQPLHGDPYEGTPNANASILRKLADWKVDERMQEDSDKRLREIQTAPGVCPSPLQPWGSPDSLNIHALVQAAPSWGVYVIGTAFPLRQQLECVMRLFDVLSKIMRRQWKSFDETLPNQVSK